MDTSRLVPSILLVAGGILLLIGLLPIVAKLLGADLGASIVGEIKLATDINPWLERLLLAVLGAVATVVYLKFNFSLSWNKQLIGMALIGGMWAATYGYLAWITSDPIEGPWFTTDGRPQRCYVLEPQRVRLLHLVERDPRTGAPCRAVTEGMHHKLREWLVAQRDAEARGEKLALRPVDSPAAFFGFAGDPLVWYYRRDDGSCEYFEIPGFHPQHQDELLPITKQARTACEKAAALVASRKAADDAREARAARDAARARAEAEEVRARYERYVGAPLTQQSTLVATADLGPLSATALDVVRERGPTVLLKASFTSDGVFDSAWNGGADLARLGVGAARGIVLLRPASGPRVTRTAALQGLTFLRQEFSVLTVRPADAYAVRRHGFVAEGRAFNDADAEAALRSDFAAKLRSVITQL